MCLSSRRCYRTARNRIVLVSCELDVTENSDEQKILSLRYFLLPRINFAKCQSSRIRVGACAFRLVAVTAAAQARDRVVLVFCQLETRPKIAANGRF